jgi:hypothetical protein
MPENGYVAVFLPNSDEHVISLSSPIGSCFLDLRIQKGGDSKNECVLCVLGVLGVRIEDSEEFGSAVETEEGASDDRRRL